MEAKKALEFLKNHADDMVHDVAELVAIDSGSYCKEGIDRIGDMVAEKLSGLGFSVETVVQERFGNHRIARREGTVPLSVLLIGHLDTVFPAGSAASIPFTVDGDRATGAGVLDMKSCLVATIYALKAIDVLHQGAIPKITVLLIGDEEIGSETARDLIIREGKEADYALVIEGARANGAVVVERKGTGFLDLMAKGRAAHAGNEPEVGRSAVDEIAAKILKLRQLQDLETGTTVTAGQMGGGTARNVVAEEAWAKIDLRFRTMEAQKQLFESIETILAKSDVEGVQLEYNLIFNRPPLNRVSGSERLEQLTEEVMTELGIPYRTAVAGGASDGNFTAAAGTPTLDGLGPVGGMMCSPEEYLDIHSLPERAAVQALLITRLAENDNR